MPSHGDDASNACSDIHLVSAETVCCDWMQASELLHSRQTSRCIFSRRILKSEMEMELTATEATRRIRRALVLAMRLRSIDASQHKAYVIDQMVRALTGYYEVHTISFDARGRPYECDATQDTEDYRQFVAAARHGDDGPDSREWDIGVAP